MEGNTLRRFSRQRHKGNTIRFRQRLWRTRLLQTRESNCRPWAYRDAHEFSRSRQGGEYHAVTLDVLAI